MRRSHTDPMQTASPFPGWLRINVQKITSHYKQQKERDYQNKLYLVHVFDIYLWF